MQLCKQIRNNDTNLTKYTLENVVQKTTNSINIFLFFFFPTSFKFKYYLILYYFRRHCISTIHVDNKKNKLFLN